MIARCFSRLIAVAVAAGVLSGCERVDEPAGEVRTETRTVGSFDSVDMDGSARLLIAVGQPESVSINGPENVLERMTTEVAGNTLHIRTRRKGWVWGNARSRVTVNITVPRLALLRLQGGNSARLEGLKSGELLIDVEGAARVWASGELDKLTVNVDGAGMVDLEGLTATAAHVTVDGVGRVSVHPKDTLDATMNGVGAIFYVGTPSAVSTHMNGLGTIAQRADAAERKRLREARKEERKRLKEEKRRRKSGNGEADPDIDPETDATPDVDPDNLQPERDDRTPPVKQPIADTEVI